MIGIAPAFLFRSTPQLLVFFVTARCDCRCRMCFYLPRIAASDPSVELTPDEAGRIFRGYGPLAYLKITGGEPTLRPDLPELVLAAAGRRPRLVEVSTNGGRAEPLLDLAERFARALPSSLLSVQLSVDGWGDLHDEIRGRPGLFERVRRTNRLLAAAAARLPNLRVEIVTVFSSGNAGRLEEFLDQVGEGFFFHRLILTGVHGTAPEGARADVGGEAFRRLRLRVSALNAAGARAPSSRLAVRFKEAKDRLVERWESERNLGRFCGALRRLGVLSEAGEVFACEPLWASLGNVRDHGYDLRAVLRSPAAREFARKLRRSDPPCHCSWSCAQTCALIGNPRFWPALLR